MKRRDLFKGGALAFLGGALISPYDTIAGLAPKQKLGKTAKNIIFLVSDGMSLGTLNLASMLLERKNGKTSNWLSLYQQQGKVTRALMETASANSLVTDSAAASSSWGGGVRVPNGSLNVNADGSENMPIWQKFKKAGKSAGVVTSVMATHATPAGFCVNSKKRSDEAGIAKKYLELGIDVVMGGGLENFDAKLRKDKQDVFADYTKKGYAVCKDRQSLLAHTGVKQPVLGIFYEDALPYAIDRASEKELAEKVPTLAEMTKQAIATLSQNKNGFVLQVEGGKVDWAAHANDTPAALYDQIAFDEAIAVAIEFAEKNRDTLVVVTTDHGNSNPGLYYGSKADKNFDRLQKFKYSNNWVLNGIGKSTSASQLIERIEFAQGYAIKEEDAKAILKHYEKLDEEGLYNPYKLPYKQYAQIQSEYTSVGWGGIQHTADYVELAMFGPGSELLKPFVKNIELHNLMLEATGVMV
ncbi:alkaline phosphatase [Pseudopedobacter beijingensis]|uniref:Alkaline phosphatase n=1 Tax=Pseudopedobacter beijingensis TaxID=1207056 RepID=A0ABW4IE60_9SPHI